MSTTPPTVHDWLHGWTLTYIPNETEAERLAQHLQNHLQRHSIGEVPLSESVRSELEGLLGTARDADARSPAGIVEEILSESLPSRIAASAAAPLATRALNQGPRTLEVDVEAKLPPALAQTVERLLRPRITEDGMARIQKIYEELGAEELHRWLRRAH